MPKLDTGKVQKSCGCKIYMREPDSSSLSCWDIDDSKCEIDSLRAELQKGRELAEAVETIATNHNDGQVCCCVVCIRLRQLATALAGQKERG